MEDAGWKVSKERKIKNLIDIGTFRDPDHFLIRTTTKQNIFYITKVKKKIKTEDTGKFEQYINKNVKQY